MKIVTAVKIVPDDQDITVNGDRTLNYSKARPVVSTYDLNAIEIASTTAAANGGSNVVVSVGPASIDETKNNKNILARGVESLTLCADDSLADIDARGTAAVLAAAIKTVEGFDLVICGDGSADVYAQQTEVQLAEALGLPVVTSVSAISFEGNTLVAERTLENEKETVEVEMPAVISVVPDIAQPRICGMRDIMQAGKKPVNKLALADLGVAAACGTEVLETLAPVPAPRKKVIYDAGVDGDLDKFVAAIAEAIR